jgi:hypothetical protein
MSDTHSNVLALVSAMSGVSRIERQLNAEESVYALPCTQHSPDCVDLQ